MNRTITLTTILSLALLLAACGDDHDDHDHGEESLEFELCEHMKEGPSAAVTAADDAMASLDDVSTEHTRHDITLVDMGGMMGGFVAYQAAEAGDYVIGINDSSIPLKVWDGTMTELTIEGTAPNDECAEVQENRTVELGVGMYILEFGPTAASQVQVVIEHGSHEDEDHDHE